jgi:tyrosine-protein phosphatase SIW14
VRYLTACLGPLLVLAGLVTPVVVGARQQATTRNFRVVREGVLYRSGQMHLPALKRTLAQYGIRTVVNLREGDDDADRAEEAYCRANGVRFVRITPLSWEGVRGQAAIDSGLETFLSVVRDPANHPVLVHCHAGVHRTGLYVAFYRMEVEGWSKERALREMIAIGYDELHKHADVRGYLSSYRPDEPCSLCAPAR